MAKIGQNAYSCKRYQAVLAPFTGLNGKMAASKVKCKALVNSSDSGVKFYYGYSKNASGGKQNFALRTKSRNLTTHAYSADELQHQDLFKRAWAAVAQVIADPDTYAQALARFKADTHGYTTLRTFLFAEKYAELKSA